MENYFKKLNAINVNEKTEQKNGLTYLSWAWAWGEIKKEFPDATYTIYETTLPTGYITNYFTDGRTAWVKTGVTINGIEHIEELPVMDYKNKSIMLDLLTSFDVNKAIQRSLTKACARHGLGLYIYAGEDLPEDQKQEPVVVNREQLLEECKTLSIKLEDLADYFHKNIEELTDKDLQNAIAMKKKALASVNKVNSKSFGG